MGRVYKEGHEGFRSFEELRKFVIIEGKSNSSAMFKKGEKTMGKYQLDDKGKALVQRYHEKNSNVKQDKKVRVQELLKQAKNKKK